MKTRKIVNGIHVIGEFDPAGGNEGLLICHEEETIFCCTDGADYGSGIGDCYFLTDSQRKTIFEWDKSFYDLELWLKENCTLTDIER